MLVRQETYYKICQYGTKEWGCTTRQIDRYIQRAKVFIEEEQKKFRQRELHRGKYQQLAVLDNLFRKAYRDGDWKGCLGIVKEQNVVLGMYAARLDVLEAFQKLVEEGILPPDSLEEIKVALVTFRQSAIASLNSKTKDKDKEP